MEPGDEITTNTIRAIIFSEVGFLVNPDDLEDADIDRLGNVILPFEMGLYNLKTYDKFIREVCSEILLRIKVINKPLKKKDVRNHRIAARTFFN